MCPILKGKAIYEFYVCGNDSENKNRYASVMANWAAIEYASKNNIPTFDFMGAGKPPRAMVCGTSKRDLVEYLLNTVDS